MQGWLQKMGEVRKTLKRRWFTLSEGTVYYFEREGSSPSSALGNFQCAKIEAVVPLIDEARSGNGYTFFVVCSERTYILQAASLPEQTQWVDALRTSVAFTRPANTEQIELQVGVTTIKMDSRPWVQFQFTLSVIGVTSTIIGRYSELRSRHDELCSPAPRGVGIALEFPGKTSWLTDDNDPSNISSRATELAAYYRQLFAQDRAGTVLLSPQVHRVFGFPPEVVQAMVSVGQARQQAAQAAAEAERARIAAERAILVADQQYAQTVQSLPCAPGSAAPLVYQKPLQFQLKNKKFSFGDASIKGPGDLPYFRVLRQDGILWSGLLQNCQFSLGTLANEPLVFLQEEFELFTYRYSIYRTTPQGTQLLVCSIVRKVLASFLTANDQYDISLPTQPGIRITCTGSWPNNFTLTQAGPTGVFAAATVSKKIFAFADTYDVVIAPQMDVLLYLGIATAIDRIHHEVEERHRR